MKVSVLGTGRALPAHWVESTALDQRWGTGGRIAATGVKRRFQCLDETQIDLATAACVDAFRDAGQTIDDIDLVISGCSVPYQPIPATAPLIMRNLGMNDGTAGAFDINSTCLSFLSAFETAARMIVGGGARRALVVSSELASRALPWGEHPEIAGLFGDGAAAAVIGASGPNDPGEIKAVRLRSFPSAYEACSIGAGGTRFDFNTDSAAFSTHSRFMMDGKALFRITSKHLNSFIDELLESAGWERSEIDIVIPHQASPAGLDHMVRQTGFHPDRVIRIVEDFGNQVAASIPFAFDIARKQNRLKPGDKALILGTSAGVSFGGAALVV